MTTCHKLSEWELTSGPAAYSVPIGTCVPGWCVHLLDETEPANGGAPSLAVIAPTDLADEAGTGRRRTRSGVMYVRGPGVFLGYLNRPDLTEVAMLRSHPTLTGGALFRSGDVAHYDALGHLVFEGRRDLQIKLRGQRLEPGEIEAVLMTHTAVQMAVVRLVQPQPNQPEADFLCAYLTLNLEDPRAKVHAAGGQRGREGESLSRCCC